MQPSTRTLVRACPNVSSVLRMQTFNKGNLSIKRIAGNLSRWLALLFALGRVKPNLREMFNGSYLVDPARSHMLVSKIKPCMSKCK